MKARNVLWALIVMAASIACSALWPLGFAPSYGPADNCIPTGDGATCIAPVDISKTI